MVRSNKLILKDDPSTLVTDEWSQRVLDILGSEFEDIQYFMVHKIKVLLGDVSPQVLKYEDCYVKR